MTTSTDIQKVLLDKVQADMREAVDHARRKFNTLHTGKASPSMVENVVVDVYGTNSRLKDIAAIRTPDPRTILIQPWDKGVAHEVERSILKANLGLTPSAEGGLIRCPIPEMSKQRREELVRVSHSMAEEGRVGVRAARKEAMDKALAFDKDSSISKDDLARLKKEIQKHTDRFVDDISNLLKEKEKELMAV